MSCVEQRRWDGRRHGEAFTPAPQAAYPELRRLKNERMRERLAAGQEPRADQGEVWRRSPPRRRVTARLGHRRAA